MLQQANRHTLARGGVTGGIFFAPPSERHAMQQRPDGAKRKDGDADGPHRGKDGGKRPDDAKRKGLYLRPQFRHGENQRGKGEGLQGGGSLGEPAEGPTIADLQRCWGCPEQSFLG